jgi:4-amino-4-deoxy-L-arabinose transferase-like glycosyltransferase
MTAKRRSRARVAVKPAADGARRSAAPGFFSSTRAMLAIVFTIALVVRLVVAASIADLPIVRTPKLDSAEYLSWARQMAAGNFVWPVVSAHGPGYPLFLGAVFALGGSIWSALVLQSVAGACTAVCIAVLATRWFGREAGLGAGLLYATFAPAVYVETNLLAEGLLIFLIVAALLPISSDRPTPLRASASGVLLGLATLVRPTAVLIVVALGVALWRMARPRGAAAIAAFVATVAVVLAPAVVKNWSDSRTLNIQGFGGLNFYIGNSPLHNGRPVFRLGSGWDELNSEAQRAGIADPSAQDRYYIRKTIGEIGAHPTAYARLLAEKVLWLVQADEVRDSHSFYFFTTQSALLSLLPRMAVLIPFAATGIFVLAIRRRAPLLLIAYAIGASLGVVLLVVGTRYRLPVVPALAIVGGVGGAALVDAFSRRDLRQLAAMLVAAAVGVGASHVLGDPSSRNLAEEWAFTGSALITEHRLADAEAAYRQALAANSSSGLAWDGLGLALVDEQRWSEARSALDRASALDPTSARTTYHLALVDEAQSKPADAVVRLRRSLEIDPTNLDAARHLASDLIRLQRDEEAIPILNGIVAHAPNDAEAHRALAGALGGVGRLRDAKNELATSVRLTPSNGETWLDLCLVSLDLGEMNDAVSACRHAREYGASPDRLALAERALAARQGREGQD